MPITNERHEALYAAWESCRDRWPIGYGEFAKAMQGWSVEPVRVDGRIVGAMLMRGAEIHVGVKDDGKRRWATRRFLRATLGKTVRAHGRAVTAVMHDNERGQAFVQRLGFVPVGTLPKAILFEYRGHRYV
jgi:hypothetical protein